MKKVAVAGLAFALLTMTFASVPVMAKAEKVPVVGLSILQGGLPPSRSWEADDGIHQVRGAMSWGINFYWFDRTSIPFNFTVPPTYMFNSTSEISSMINEKTLSSVSHWKAVMRYPVSLLSPELGRFEGVMQVRTEVLESGTFTTMHCVYQGSGIFEGQTLVVSGTKLGSQAGVIEGFLLTR